MLVRTDPKRAKHEGISFLLLDMRQSGVVTKPIPLISGASMFCETFLTDVVAPTGALLGEPNGGWTVGKRLLQHERTSQSGQTRGARPLPRLSDIAKRRLDVDETGRLADGDFRARLVHLEMDAHVQSLTVARTAAEAASGSTAGPHSAASVLKNAATDVLQIRQEMLVELMGYRGLGWAGEPFDPDEVEAVRTWLLGRSASILGGSREIQNNIIAKRILGLPDPVGGT
jgi:alkylation response protein AidB-like acyl-CoA dehydrogenase